MTAFVFDCLLCIVLDNVVPQWKLWSASIMHVLGKYGQLLCCTAGSCIDRQLKCAVWPADYQEAVSSIVDTGEAAPEMPCSPGDTAYTYTHTMTVCSTRKFELNAKLCYLVLALLAQWLDIH